MTCTRFNIREATVRQREKYKKKFFPRVFSQCKYTGGVSRELLFACFVAKVFALRLASGYCSKNILNHVCEAKRHLHLIKNGKLHFKFCILHLTPRLLLTENIHNFFITVLSNC